jgi:hypothetical protein
MIVKVQNVYINTDHVSMVALKEASLVVDFAYSKPDGPVFLVFNYDSEEEATAALATILMGSGSLKVKPEKPKTNE